MFRLPVVETVLSGRCTLYLGAWLAGDGNLAAAIASKPRSYRTAFFLEGNYWLDELAQQFKVYYPVSFVFDYRTQWPLVN